MRVAELEARLVRIPLRKPIKHASHARTDTDNVVVRCTLSDGTVGYGEGVPRDYVTGETAGSTLDRLRAAGLGGQLAAECTCFTDAVSLAERLTLPADAGDDRLIRGNAARCAVELAVLDAFGRAFGVPLSQATEFVEPDLYEPKGEVRYSGVITSARGAKAWLAGWKMWGYGFKQVKVKVGIPGHDDVKRLKVIRGRVGRRMDIRIDANEAWPAEQAAARIRELEPFGVTSVEQPIPHEDVAALADIRRQVRTPIMLDESPCGEVDAERAAKGGWCDLFNLRLSKCGGFVPTLRLAALAARHGLGYQLGCQVGETAILSAAGRHFAASVKGIRYLEGSYDRHLVRESLGTTDITFGYGGKAPALTGGGLGVSIDAARLDAVTVRKESLL